MARFIKRSKRLGGGKNVEEPVTVSGFINEINKRINLIKLAGSDGGNVEPPVTVSGYGNKINKRNIRQMSVDVIVNSDKTILVVGKRLKLGRLIDTASKIKKIGRIRGR